MTPTRLTNRGAARMVDVFGKQLTVRLAGANAVLAWDAGCEFRKQDAGRTVDVSGKQLTARTARADAAPDSPSAARPATARTK